MPPIRSFAFLACLSALGCAGQQRMTLFDMQPGEEHLAVRSGDEWVLQPAPRPAPVRRSRPPARFCVTRVPAGNRELTGCFVRYASGRELCVATTSLAGRR